MNELIKSPYQDRWSRYHDKPCVNGEPSSNNGWIYTAYAWELGFGVIPGLLRDCYNQSKPIDVPDYFYVYRSPGKVYPPLSRDEVLGLYWLSTHVIEELRQSKWIFSPIKLPRFNLFLLLLQLWRLRGKHRNTFWQETGYEQVYRLAFSVPIQDRAYMLRDSGYPIPLFYRFYEWISNKLSSRSNSSRLIAWRKGLIKLDKETLSKELPFYEHHLRSIDAQG